MGYIVFIQSFFKFVDVVKLRPQTGQNSHTFSKSPLSIKDLNAMITHRSRENFVIEL